MPSLATKRTEAALCSQQIVKRRPKLQAKPWVRTDSSAKTPFNCSFCWSKADLQDTAILGLGCDLVDAELLRDLQVACRIAGGLKLDAVRLRGEALVIAALGLQVCCAC